MPLCVGLCVATLRFSFAALILAAALPAAAGSLAIADGTFFEFRWDDIVTLDTSQGACG